ncbi:hypothetical protein ARC78_00490 [Stenotrophomonas pictorum JCM 9942]|jgi:uncharacterized Tic20 family protein|uniref:Orotate phosphoribosyltransferase n=1 Tax=Stenotrophomonas pictorum JCM 9942 TaxID=1236960 RepID=A0A0R0AK26_9GAMM|nr:DUF4870 domain-containing protein [Stenotrophomonas pictorum]KRG45471.1 hypothetical protein ARC78_00490 [Stenotrophomonas pictorum JCM 9942]
MSDFDNITTPPPPPSSPAQGDDNTLAMLVHLSGIVLWFIVPLIVWLVNKDKPEKAFLTDQSKEALNFQITLTGVYIIGTILTVILIGMLINFAAWVACIVLSILAGLAANRGEAYRYPFAIRLIK